MLERMIKSIVAHFQSIELMNAYVQSMPEGVEYPCYLVNKVDLDTEALNAYYYMNTVKPYIRVFSRNEIDLGNKVSKITSHLFGIDERKIPILNEDGSKSGMFMRIEDIETYPLPVDENEAYCREIVFTFDTTHQVSVEEFELLSNFDLTQ